MAHMIQRTRLVPFRCKACKDTERPHKARGLCARCYDAAMKRTARKQKKV